jgi:TIR domain/WD domain, G-beta repeat
MADVFISYSRRDIELVSSLCDGLRSLGKTVFVDLGERVQGFATAAQSATAAQESGIAAERARAEISGIPPSAQWMDELRAAIRAADNVVVVISPDSATSAVCREELDYAVELHKRLVPVVVRATSPDAVIPALANLNWLSVAPGPSFAADVDRLAEVLDTNVDGLRLHTRLTERSSEWISGGRERSLLLRGKDLEAAEQWLAAQAARKPTPTAEQTGYIMASRAAATRRQRGSVTIGVALALVMTALTVVAGVQWRSAVAQRRAAVAQGAIATSRALAAESATELEPDPQLALLLALRGYDAAHTTQAQAAIRAAVGDSTVRGYLPPLQPKDVALGCPASASAPGAFDPAGQYVVVTCDGWAEVWRWSAAHGPGSPASPYKVRIGGNLSGAIFSHDGNDVLVAGSGGRIYQWAWRTAEHPRVVGSGFTSPVLFASSSGPIVASEDGQAISIVNLRTRTGTTIRVPCCSFQEASLNPAFAFSSSGGQIATLTSPDQNVNSAPTLSVFAVSSGARLFSRAVPGAQLPVALSSAGEVAVAVGTTAEVFSVAHPSQSAAVDHLVSPAGLPAHCCDVDSPLALAWSPDGRDLAVGSEDPWTRVWTAGSAAPVYLDDSGETGAYGVAFSPDGQYLLTSGSASQVWQWQAATPRSVPSAGTAVSPNGQIFAVAEPDNGRRLVRRGLGGRRGPVEAGGPEHDGNLPAPVRCRWRPDPRPEQDRRDADAAVPAQRDLADGPARRRRGRVQQAGGCRLGRPAVDAGQLRLAVAGSPDGALQRHAVLPVRHRRPLSADREEVGGLRAGHRVPDGQRNRAVRQHARWRHLGVGPAAVRPGGDRHYRSGRDSGRCQRGLPAHRVAYDADARAD